MSEGRYMVCKACLKEFWGGWEKSCSHGFVFPEGGGRMVPRTGTCSKCGKPTSSLHCPDGSSFQGSA